MKNLLNIYAVKMGLMDKNNKKQISKSLEISSIKVVMSGLTSVLTALDPLPDYINEGYGDVGSDHCWAIAQIVAKLKTHGLDILLFPDRLKQFVAEDLGAILVNPKFPTRHWLLRYKTVRCNPDYGGRTYMKIVGPCNCTEILFTIYLEEDEDIVDYINSLESHYIL